MRVISFYADGIVNAADAGFFDWIAKQDADIICIQNLQAQEYDLPGNRFFPEGYFPYFFDMPDNKNGVAIYTRELPKAIMTSIGVIDSMEARYIQADFQTLSVICLMAPDDSEALHRQEYLEAISNHLTKIRNKRREFLVCASLGIAHLPIDTNDANNPIGQNTEERQWLTNLTADGHYIDAFRLVNQDPDEFTWHREDGLKLRSDYQIISQGLRYGTEYGVVYKNERFGSHSPVIMDYDFELF